MKAVVKKTTRTVRRRYAPPVPLTSAYNRIWEAIVDHSLPPGTRLIEDRLCSVFNLGRTRIRQVLQRLAHEHVVTLMPNRGAVVSEPTPEQARDVFDARAVIESAVVGQLLEHSTRADRRVLRAHLVLEKLAWRQNKRRDIIRLSGEFHLILMSLTRNLVLLDTMREYVSRSSLIIALYQPIGAVPCPPREHEALIVALENADRSAVQLMRDHLRHVFESLNLQPKAGNEVDLLSVLTDVA